MGGATAFGGSWTGGAAAFGGSAGFDASGGGRGLAVAALDHRDHLVLLDLVPLLHQKLRHAPSDRRRHVGRRLLSFHFDQRLALLHDIADLDFDVNHVAAGNIVSKARQFYFKSHT